MVKKVGGGLEVWVTHGSVSVLHRVRTQPPNQAAEPTVTLKAGYLAKIDSQGRLTATELGEEEQIRRIAWTVGKVVFDATPLAQALQEMNRYSERSSVIADANLRDLPVSGIYSTDGAAFLGDLLVRSKVAVLEPHGPWPYIVVGPQAGFSAQR